jgi:hypothetical protein
MTLARISISIPDDLVAAADRRAAELERSRSWLLVEALQRYLEEAPPPPSVREPRSSYPPQDTAPEIAAARRRRLEAELQLSPAARLERAEELVRLADEAHPRSRRTQIIGFPTYEDFYSWKRSRLITG